MPDKDKIISIGNDSFNKRDLEIILEVNRKAVEIETAVADQNEEIIDLLNSCKTEQEGMNKKIDKIVIQGEENSKEIFKMQVLFVTGLLALVAQIVQIFLKK